MKKIIRIFAASLLTLGCFACSANDGEFKPSYDTTKEYTVNVVGH